MNLDMDARPWFRLAESVQYLPRAWGSSLANHFRTLSWRCGVDVIGARATARNLKQL
jgi:hypothetical protein